ncbi:Ras GAP domain-containing protein [Pelomyxa schiedti]|nr:Ras GAP domain-containing protein [Pelomyxa schiedti]
MTTTMKKLLRLSGTSSSPSISTTVPQSQRLHIARHPQQAPVRADLAAAREHQRARVPHAAHDADRDDAAAAVADAADGHRDPDAVVVRAAVVVDPRDADVAVAQLLAQRQSHDRDPGRRRGLGVLVGRHDAKGAGALQLDLAVAVLVALGVAQLGRQRLHVHQGDAVPQVALHQRALKQLGAAESSGLLAWFRGFLSGTSTPPWTENGEDDGLEEEEMTPYIVMGSGGSNGGGTVADAEYDGIVIGGAGLDGSTVHHDSSPNTPLRNSRGSRHMLINYRQRQSTELNGWQESPDICSTSPRPPSTSPRPPYSPIHTLRDSASSESNSDAADTPKSTVTYMMAQRLSPQIPHVVQPISRLNLPPPPYHPAPAPDASNTPRMNAAFDTTPRASSALDSSTTPRANSTWDSGTPRIWDSGTPRIWDSGTPRANLESSNTPRINTSPDCVNTPRTNSSPESATTPRIYANSSVSSSNSGYAPVPLSSAHKTSSRERLLYSSHKNATMRNLAEYLTVINTSLLTLKIISGRNIRGTKGKPASAFCVVRPVEPANDLPPKAKKKIYKTECSMKDLNPVWEQEFEIEFSNSVSSIIIQVFDHHKLQKDDVIGEIEIRVAEFFDFSTHTLPLRIDSSTKASGELEISCKVVTALERNEDVRITKLHYDKLHSLIITEDASLLLLLCAALENKCDESFAISVVRLFNRDGLAQSLVTNLLCREVTRILKTGSTVVLRADTIATKLCTQYAKLIGYHYLTCVLKPQVEVLLQSNSQLYEMDPDKTSPSDLSTNASELVSVSTRLVEAIMSPSNFLPRSLHQVIHSMNQFAVTIGHPEFSTAISVAIFFLRYICPAVMFPEQWDIASGEVTTETRRALVMVTKIIQSLANPSKQQEVAHEPTMELILPKIQPLREPMEQFLQRLKESPTNGLPDASHSILLDEDYPILMSVLIRKFAEKIVAMEKVLNAQQLDSATASAKLVRDFQDLKAIITQHQFT